MLLAQTCGIPYQMRYEFPYPVNHLNITTKTFFLHRIHVRILMMANQMTELANVIVSDICLCACLYVYIYVCIHMYMYVYVARIYVHSLKLC